MGAKRTRCGDGVSRVYAGALQRVAECGPPRPALPATMLCKQSRLDLLCDSATEPSLLPTDAEPDQRLDELERAPIIIEAIMEVTAERLRVLLGAQDPEAAVWSQPPGAIVDAPYPVFQLLLIRGQPCSSPTPHGVLASNFR